MKKPTTDLDEEIVKRKTPVQISYKFSSQLIIEEKLLSITPINRIETKTKFR